jgi:hypothetical protein
MGNRLDQLPDKAKLDVPDPFLELPATLPLALRLQTYAQARTDKSLDAAPEGERAAAKFDFQTPYQLKLLSGAPIGKDLSYYLYAVYAERGQNGSVALDDAWVLHHDLFGSGVSAQIGQFQVSELMFARELRTTYQDYLVYRMAGLTYDRGVLFGREVGPFELALGFANGNGSDASFSINSAGFQRPNRSFDNSSDKSTYARFSLEDSDLGAVGLFAFVGRQQSVTGDTGSDVGNRLTGKSVLGLDLSGDIGGGFSWFGQFLWNRWDGILDTAPARKFIWTGGFLGLDYQMGSRWLLSGLLNLTDSGDFAGTGTIFEGIDSRILSVSVSYYTARNLKLVIEGGFDFLTAGRESDSVGHRTREHYGLVGLDLAM